MVSEGPTDIALFRYEIIAPLLSIAGPRGTLKHKITQIAAKQHEHPRRGLIAVGGGTIEEWLLRYRRDGLGGLEDKRRRDLGKSRKIDGELAEAITELAEGRPELDGPGLLAELAARLEGTALPALSTLYRFLRSRGLDQRRAPGRKDHRAFAFDLAGDCWQGDVMFGPTLPTTNGRRRKTYLIAILDDATRVIVHAEFYFEQHLRSLKDCLKQAMLKRGVPRRFYFDNGQIFRSRLLLALCARLGIQLIHTRPYQPQGRAKLERWFLTVRRGFLSRIDPDRCGGLDALNRLLFAWIEGEYHQRPHRGIGGETPLDRWMMLSDGIRPPPLDVDLDALFMDEATRRVAKDGTLALGGRRFEAGPRFIGRKVTVRFDPFDLRSVLAVTDSGESVRAFPVDLTANRRVRRQPSPAEDPPPAQPPLQSLDQLANDMEPPEDK
ncbi:MAG: DDE-type integrase/transposase/recombinase [Planctomycetota bacterium]